MITDSPWFIEWFNSAYYHLLYTDRNEAEAARFAEHVIRLLQPPAGARMFDVACGRGRLSKILASRGYDVTGIDIATESIRFAQQFQTDHLHFYVHDMRMPCWINYFDYAFNFFTSFGYFETRREHEDAIRTIAQSIRLEGVFILDYLNVHYAESHLVHQHEVVVDGVNFAITKWFDEGHFYKKILVEDERLDHPLEFTEKVAKFTLGDFTEMFAFHGLQVMDVYGDYDFNSYHLRHSPRLVILARRIRLV